MSRLATALLAGVLADAFGVATAIFAVAIVTAADDELLGSIILKQLADRQLHAGPGVVRYLVTHMERSTDSARPVRGRTTSRSFSRHTCRRRRCRPSPTCSPKRNYLCAGRRCCRWRSWRPPMADRR